MKATKLIEMLKEHVRKHGDSEIVVHDPQFIFSPEIELNYQGDDKDESGFPKAPASAPWSLEYKITKDHDSSI